MSLYFTQIESENDDAGDVEMTPAPQITEPANGPLGISANELFNRGPNAVSNVGSNGLPNVGSNVESNVGLKVGPNVGLNVGSNAGLNDGSNVGLNAGLNIGSSSSNVRFDNVDLKSANDISDDWLSKRFQSRGIGDFNIMDHSLQMVKKYHVNLHEPLKMKIMSMDPALKSSECLGQKFDPRINYFPRMIMGDMVQEHLRRLMNAGLPAKDAFEAMIFAFIFLDEFTVQFDTQAGLECAQRIGSKLSFGICPSNLDVVHVVKSSIDETVIRNKKLYGFDKIYNLPANKKYNKNKKAGYVDMAQFKDKTSPLFVPQGYCIFHHRLPRGCNRGAKCNHKHSMWTAEELAAAKK